MINLQSIVRATGGDRRKKTRLLKPVRPSRRSEVFYRGRLLALVAQLKEAARVELLPKLKAMEPGYARDDARWGDNLEGSFARLAAIGTSSSAWALRQVNKVAELVLTDVDTRLVVSIRQSLKVDITGVLSRPSTIRDAMAAAVKANVDLITNIPEQYLEKLQAAIYEGMAKGLRYEDLAKEIERIGEVTESRAKLIARDQIGKLNSDFNRVRQTDLGIEEYEWSTSGDERVRDEHAELNGETFRWDSSPPDGHPGEAVNCRCVAIPKFHLEEPEKPDEPSNETDSSQ